MAEDCFGEMDRETAEEDHWLFVSDERWMEGRGPVLKNGIHFMVTHIPAKKFVLPRRQRRKLYATGDCYGVSDSAKEMEEQEGGETYD
jgi:hypothetical protein